jgi:hypothetical protein
MSDPPFSVSPEAAAYIEESLRSGETDPELAGLIPALCQFFGSRTWDAAGRLVDQCRGEGWRIGYRRADDIAGHVSVGVCGRSLLIHPDSLKNLSGRRLVLDTVAVSRPADQKATRLRAT